MTPIQTPASQSLPRPAGPEHAAGLHEEPHAVPVFAGAPWRRDVARVVVVLVVALMGAWLAASLAGLDPLPGVTHLLRVAVPSHHRALR